MSSSAVLTYGVMSVDRAPPGLVPDTVTTPAETPPLSLTKPPAVTEKVVCACAAAPAATKAVKAAVASSRAKRQKPSAARRWWRELIDERRMSGPFSQHHGGACRRGNARRVTLQRKAKKRSRTGRAGRENVTNPARTGTNPRGGVPAAAIAMTGNDPSQPRTNAATPPSASRFSPIPLQRSRAAGEDGLSRAITRRALSSRIVQAGLPRASACVAPTPLQSPWRPCECWPQCFALVVVVRPYAPR